VPEDPSPHQEAISDGSSVRLREGLPFCAVVFLMARIAVSLTAVLTVSNHSPDPSAIGPGTPPAPFTVAATPGLHNAIDGMDRWDAAWFAYIAQDGYGSDQRAAFMPGYPMLIRAFTPLFGDPGAGTFVSNVSYLLALVVLFALTAEELGRERARPVVAFFAAMPASFFFLAPYSEAPFLLATVLAFWWSRARRPVPTALAAIAATLIRVLGVTLVPALAVMWWRKGERARVTALAVALSPLLGLAAYGAWWGLVKGDALAPVNAQTYWHRTPSVPMVPFVRGVGLGVVALVDRTHPWLAVDAAITLAVVVSAIWMVRRIPGPYSVYTWTALLVPIATAPDFRPLYSLPRLTCALFPIAWTWVIVLRHRTPLAITVAAMAASQLALAAVFMRWGWIF
jgi:hypothetical protein